MSRGLTIGFGQVPLTLPAAKGLVTVEGPDVRFSANASGTVATPTISPAAGSYTGTQTISLACSTPSSSIYYTTDGSIPTFPITGTTQLYTGTFAVAVSETVSAIGAATGLANSSIASAAYIIGGGSGFDFYISPTGNDANPGTFASPWAVTSLCLSTQNANNVANCRAQAGKRVGFMPGTYDISALMYGGSSGAGTGGLILIGGTSGAASTYWGSCDSSGNYSPRTATLNAKTSGGVFGGGHSTGPGVYDGPMVAHCGSFPSSYAVGFATIDGLRFTGFSYKAVRIGGSSSGDGPVITAPVTVQNCEFTGGGFNAGDSTDNCAALWLDRSQNAPVIATNNWIHDNIGHTAGSGDHLNAIILWGFGSPNSYGTTIQFNTVKNAGNIYGKEGGVEGVTIQYNYVDASMLVAGPGYQDFSGTGQSVSGLTIPSLIQNNIAVVQGDNAGGYEALCGLSTYASFGTAGWQTPVTIRNNTVINAAGAGSIVGFLQVLPGSAAPGNAVFFNNIYADPGGSGGSLNGAGNFRANPSALQLMDYNLSPSSGVSWVVSNDPPAFSGTSYSTPSAFAGAYATAGGISGVEAHSVRGVPTFTNTGLYAALYKLQSGSVGQGTGSTNGTVSGSACDMGAWGGATPPTQIGCNFAT